MIVLPQRPPLLIAKQWATLDALSGGRTILGVGAGWMREEFEALGFGHTFDRRGVATDEAIHLFRRPGPRTARSSSTARSTSSGPVLMEPKPARRASFRSGLAGTASRSIRRAAEIGDGWQPLRIPVEELHRPHRLPARAADTLRPLASKTSPSRSASRRSRPATARRMPRSGSWPAIPDACAEKLRRYAAAGVEHFLVNCPRGASTAAMLEAYEYVAREVRPRLEAMIGPVHASHRRQSRAAGPSQRPRARPDPPDRRQGQGRHLLDARRRGAPARLRAGADDDEHDGRFAAAVAWPRVLELYAGSGALAIEALSRGAVHADLVESSADARRAIVDEPRRRPDLTERASVHALSSETAVSTFRGTYDLILLDPPYDAEGVRLVLERLAGGGLLDRSGMVVWEHSRSTVPPELHRSSRRRGGGLKLLRTRHHGAASVSLYAPREVSKAA